MWLNDFFILYPLIFIFIIIIFILLIIKMEERKRAQKFYGISEFSFQKYARFYGNTILRDPDFESKMKSIYELIVKKKETDIKKIASISKCSYDECILKIRYLKNKRIIGDYYIDCERGEIKPCSKEDRLLIKKYAPYIYSKHYQIDEIAVKLPEATLANIEEMKEKVLNELDYLDKKNLINGLNIDRVDKKIIYYTIEKHKKEKDYVSVNCKNCGALNDIPRLGKTRCEYCETIMEDITLE